MHRNFAGVDITKLRKDRQELMDMIANCHQDIIQAGLDAVVGALYSDFLTQDPVLLAFGKIVADLCVQSIFWTLI